MLATNPLGSTIAPPGDDPVKTGPVLGTSARLRVRVPSRSRRGLRHTVTVQADGRVSGCTCEHAHFGRVCHHQTTVALTCGVCSCGALRRLVLTTYGLGAAPLYAECANDDPAWPMHSVRACWLAETDAERRAA